MNAYCDYHGVELIPWGPLHAGDLARPLASQGTSRSDSVKGTPFERKFSESDEEIVKRVEEIAKKKGWKMSQVAVVWSKSKVSSPIVGISSVCVTQISTLYS